KLRNDPSYFSSLKRLSIELPRSSHRLTVSPPPPQTSALLPLDALPSSVRSLRLHGCNFDPPSSSESLLFIPSLSKLTISTTHVVSFQPVASAALTRLRLRNCYLTSLPPIVFSRSILPSLTLLDVSYNSLPELILPPPEMIQM